MSLVEDLQQRYRSQRTVALFETEFVGADALDGFVADVTTIAQSQCERVTDYAAEVRQLLFLCSEHPEFIFMA